MNEIRADRIGGLYDQVTRWGIWNKEKICPTLTAAMGEGGGHVPMVIEEVEDGASFMGRDWRTKV